MIRDDENRLSGLLASSVAMLLVLTGCLLTCLPREYAMLMMSWVMLSVSVGIGFGHCVLNEP